MRLFFLILLLANLALWYWHQPVVDWLHASAPERTPRPSALDVPPLVLLAERDAVAAKSEAVTGRKPAPAQSSAPSPAPSSAPSTAADAAQRSTPAPPVPAASAGADAASSPAQTQARVQSQARHAPEPATPIEPRIESAPVRTPAPTVTAAANTAGSCVEIGPWNDAAAAEAARARALGEGVQAELVTVERLRPAGFWMLTADRYDRAGARETLQSMQEQGVQDIAIVSLDSGWAISLGLYSRNAALERRRAQMLELGYAAEVRERSETRTEYLLRLSSGPAAVTAAQKIAASTPGVEWRTTDCLVAPD